MRKALNENPRVQIAVLGIGGILLAFMLLTSMGGGSPEPDPAADTASSSASASADLAASASASSAPTTGTAPVPATDAATGTPPSSSEGLLAGEGLPKDLLIAYARNKAIALLVIDPKGISDGTVEQYTTALRSRGDVEVFVVPAGKIADYARITEGVSVTRTPSLVVIRPRAKSGDVPTATVSEGFRSAKSIRTALEDALYSGGNVPSYPE